MESLSSAHCGALSLLGFSVSENSLQATYGGGNKHVLNPRSAPKIKNMFTSAVASSTAVGTLETRISCAVHACTSI